MLAAIGEIYSKKYLRYLLRLCLAVKWVRRLRVIFMADYNLVENKRRVLDPTPDISYNTGLYTPYLRCLTFISRCYLII